VRARHRAPGERDEDMHMGMPAAEKNDIDLPGHDRRKNLGRLKPHRH
jgi:hypothetical protein